MALEADYIIVGGGLVGCALATRLKEGDPAAEVLFLEAGTDASGDPRTANLFAGFVLRDSELDWQYKTAPQTSLDGREVSNVAGKVLGGGSVLNYGRWVRGDAADYEDWATTVGDSSYSYDGLLPYFRRSENYFDKSASSEERGFEGPIQVVTVSGSSEARKYGLRDPLKDAFTELGVPLNGSPGRSLAGLCEITENWGPNGSRQPANQAYGLKGVKVLTSTVVQNVLFETGTKPRAVGVQTSEGQKITARKEVIISAGTWRSPQVLMLSGIGPKQQLSELKIPVIRDLPAVGEGMFDHFALFQFFKVRHPDRPLSMGNPHWTDPAYMLGLPADWAVNDVVPEELLRPAIEHDNAQTKDPSVRRQNQALLRPGRPHVEECVMYAPILPGIPVNGSIVAVSTMLLVPSSRGSTKLASADPRERPISDPNYFSSEVDRTVLRYGTRRVMKALLQTKAGKPSSSILDDVG